MNTLWSEIKAWVSAKGGVLHVLAIVYAALFVWDKSSPAFGVLITQLWGTFPTLLQSIITAVIQILALYGVGSGVQTVAKKAFAKKPEVKK